MRGWRFVVDESGFAFETSDPKRIESAFAQFLELLVVVRETPGQIRRSDFLFEIESADRRTLVDRLNDPEIDRDTRHELWGRLDKLAVYEVEPPSWDVEVDGLLVAMAPSVAVCLAEAASGRRMACLTTETAGRRGRLGARANPELAGDVHFLVQEKDGPDFWRSVLLDEPRSIEQLGEGSRFPFPHCVFADGIWGQLGRFDGAATDVWPRLVAILGGVDDHAVRIWNEHVESFQRIEQMRALAGVDCSPESPNTHANAGAMRRRTVLFGDKTVRCEWHAKLERHRNRVHFAVRDGQVYIGLFVDHLPT